MIEDLYLAVLPALLALHEWPANITSARGCVPPGQCTPPSTRFHKIIRGVVPGQQWNDNGGFCGAFSLQHAALSAGAWISQDLVRKANRDEPGFHFMHGNRTLGFEVMPSNIAYTASALRLAFTAWDYTQASPQAAPFKRWLKAQLAQGHPIVWFPMCKGDPHICYPGSCPNGGRVDHVEPMFGIFSNHPLDDPTVYPDDWIVHASDQDYLPYYRRLDSLDDTPAMDGNCAHAGRGFGKNEMYPCFDSSVTYGLAVTGLAFNGSVPVKTLPVSVMTGGAVYEPNVRLGQQAKRLTANVTVADLVKEYWYVVYRYESTENLPIAPPFDVGYTHKVRFRAMGSSHTFADPHSFSSDSAVYWVAVPCPVAADGRRDGEP